MGQKSGPGKEPAEKLSRRSGALPDGSFRQRRRSASCCLACVARTASPSCAAAKGSSRTSMAVTPNLSSSGLQEVQLDLVKALGVD